MRRILVEMDEVLKTANKIDNAKEEYQRLYNELYSQIDRLGSSWQGRDNLAFTTKIKSYEDDFRRIAIIMTQYSDFLRNSAKAYESTQNELYNQANRLKA